MPLALRLSVPDAQELCPQPVITCDTHRRTGEVTPAGLQATGEQDLALNSPPCDLKAGEPIRPRERKSVSGRHPLIGEPGAGLARDLSRNQESDAQPTEPPEWDP